MTNQKPEYLTPALIGGAAAGVLSGIPLVNCLCCLWIIGGAILATHLLARSSAVSLTAGDGAIVGALTGIVAAVVEHIISLPLRAINQSVYQGLMERLARFANQVPSQFQEWMQRGTTTEFSMAMFLLGLFISAALFAVLGVLGGVIGASLFGKKSSQASPPTPPQAQGPTNATA